MFTAVLPVHDSCKSTNRNSAGAGRLNAKEVTAARHFVVSAAGQISIRAAPYSLWAGHRIDRPARRREVNGAFSAVHVLYGYAQCGGRPREREDRIAQTLDERYAGKRQATLERDSMKTGRLSGRIRTVLDQCLLPLLRSSKSWRVCTSSR